MSALLPCVSRTDSSAGRASAIAHGRDVVVRNSTYRFSEDEADDLPSDSRRSTPQHRLHADTEAFQS